MINNPFAMVVAIILIITIGKVLTVRYKSQNGIIGDMSDGQTRMIADPDSARMRDEITMLKDRIQVLERIATDNNSANDITRQIEQLRDT
jgi:hypothetical protein